MGYFLPEIQLWWHNILFFTGPSKIVSLKHISVLNWKYLATKIEFLFKIYNYYLHLHGQQLAFKFLYYWVHYI